MQLGMEKLTINYSNAATPPTNKNRTVKMHRSRRFWVCQSFVPSSFSLHSTAAQTSLEDGDDSEHQQPNAVGAACRGS